jgi:hypothetical protein
MPEHPWYDTRNSEADIVSLLPNGGVEAMVH